MIVIRFGTWSHAALTHFIYWRLYWQGYWTPFCRVEWRYRGKWVRPIFHMYENWIMGTWLGRFTWAQRGSNWLYLTLLQKTLPIPKGDNKDVDSV